MSREHEINFCDTTYGDRYRHWRIILEPPRQRQILNGNGHHVFAGLYGIEAITSLIIRHPFIAIIQIDKNATGSTLARLARPVTIVMLKNLTPYLTIVG